MVVVFVIDLGEGVKRKGVEEKVFLFVFGSELLVFGSRIELGVEFWILI